MKLNVTPRVNVDSDTTRLYRDIAQQVNKLSEGAMSASYTASVAMPTSGTYAIGDYVKKKVPVEAGSASSKYVIKGWIRLTDGSAHVLNTDWVTDRALTGN